MMKYIAFFVNNLLHDAQLQSMADYLQQIVYNFFRRQKSS